jgi:cytochrome P450
MSVLAAEGEAAPISLHEEITKLLSQDSAMLNARFDLYARLRDEAPVLAYDANSVIVSRYSTVREMYSDPTRFPSPEVWDTPFEGRFDLLTDRELAQYNAWMDYERTRVIQLNGEQHRRVRSAAQRAFSPKRMALMNDTIEGLVNRLLDELAADPERDFIKSFAYRLPLLVLLDLMGVPEEDGPQLKMWCDVILEPLGERQLRPELVSRAYEATTAFRDYIVGLIERQRSSSDRTTLVAALLDASEVDRLNEPELISMYQVLLFAGHETTTNLFGNGLFELLKSRDQWELLVREPSLIPRAVEELLRYDTPVHFIRRSSADDQEVDGVMIPAGATVLLCNAAANRDPRAFEDPDVLDVARDRTAAHISFGHGIHFCLGSSLARMEARAGFEGLVRRFPDLELGAPVDEIHYKPHWWQRSLEALPLDLGTPSGVR